MSVQTIIKETTEEVIRLEIGGEMREIRRNLEDLLNLLKQLQINNVQTADKIYNIGSINHANFDFRLGQAIWNQALPPELAGDLITAETSWVDNLRHELLRRRASVGTKPSTIFQHFGWLIETFLYKISTESGREPTLRRLSFMAEAFQSSLRYLCYIQLSTFFKYAGSNKKVEIPDFAGMKAVDEARYDYLDLLLRLTDQMPAAGRAFMPELELLVAELKKSEGSLQPTALFLTKYRDNLLRGEVADDHAFGQLLDEYLTALVYWLRQLTFLAKYRLVSIKNINVNYRLGSGKSFEHLYGELHGMYADKRQEDIDRRVIDEVFTYNQSILLFRGSNLDSCLEGIHDSDTYISLSPLLIDQSVYSEKATQTPEIYYYSGLGSAGTYLFAHYKNELAYEDKRIASNKEIEVRRTNIKDPLLDELYSQLDAIFKPLR